MALRILVKTFLFWGSREESYLMVSLVGVSCRQINLETCGQFGFRGMPV